VETDGKTYRNLVIEATSPDTNIWLGDDEGYLVQKEVGILDTDLLEGHYTVEFGLGTTTYPIHLTDDVRYTEEQVNKGPGCPRPVPRNKR
jgi:aminopeptidase C